VSAAVVEEHEVDHEVRDRRDGEVHEQPLFPAAPVPRSLLLLLFHRASLSSRGAVVSLRFTHGIRTRDLCGRVLVRAWEGGAGGKRVGAATSATSKEEGAMSILVRHAMTQAPQTIRPDMNAADAAGMMRSEDIGMLPVMDGGKLVGLVTDRDL